MGVKLNGSGGTGRTRDWTDNGFVKLNDAEIEKAMTALKFAIRALKSVECTAECENMGLLSEPVIEMYQWALREFESYRDADEPTSDERIKALMNMLEKL